MNNKTTSDIIGTWEISIFTPFGTTNSRATINSIEPFVSGTIVGEKGSLDFNNGIVENNVLTFSATVDTPIKATLTVNIEIIDDKFKGTLEVDKYMNVVIMGKKNVNL
jgi:hypothetical protein